MLAIAMSPTVKNLTLPELTQRILDMAQAGVHRESVFDALQPLGKKKHIRLAIARAKQLGMYSVASERDDQLGTYYQLDWERYQQLQNVRDEPWIQADREFDGEIIEQLQATEKNINSMLRVAGSITCVAIAASLYCLLNGRTGIGSNLLAGAVGAASVWHLQRSLCRTNS
jgi:hypothetical protein